MSLDDAHGVLIAEDDNLTGVFHGMKTPMLQFPPKPVPAEQPFNIALLPPDHTAFRSRLRAEQLL
ncbi:hypothetical protein [Leisingera sp. SS27]|uniref:hypothetical protein n=1 Tax=Leisingera sp. SS27 TaxID=2979462 RepID=UPI002FEDE624